MARFSYDHLIPALHKMAARNPFEERKRLLFPFICSYMVHKHMLNHNRKRFPLGLKIKRLLRL